MAKTQLWYETKTNPPKPQPKPWFKFWIATLAKKKHKSSSQEKHDERREIVLSDRQLERINLMNGSFLDREVAEKVALSDSGMLRVSRGDVLVGQGGKYLHPRLFKVIKV